MSDSGVGQAADLEPVRLLVVEDDEDDYTITRDLLADQQRMSVSVDWAPSYEAGLAEIAAQRHDVYLVDYRLGERTGLELIREAFQSRPVAPVVMLTGQPSVEIDLEATALGATDFLTKQGLRADELAVSLRHAITHQKAERSALAARASEDGLWDWDIAADRVYLSARVCAILGLPEEAVEVTPVQCLQRVAAEDLPRLRSELEAHLAGRTPSLEAQFRTAHRNGDWRWVELQGLATRDVDGTPIGMAGSLSDATDRHVAQERLEHEALHDTLTGLPNRTLFVDRVDQTLQRAGRASAAGCALLFIDLDEFKQINDRLGHAVGDALLVAFAGRIASALRPGDTVARLGGDEFTVLLEDLTEVDEATVVAERILQAMRDPFRIDGNELRVGVSIGIALSGAGLGPADLISAADLAMYEAKRRGRGRWSVFDERMHRRVNDRLQRQARLREFVHDGRMEVHFQPIAGLADGRIVGVEALARWPAGEEPVAPAEFIAIAEESGLIGPLGDHVTRRALEALAGWRRDGAAEDSVWVSVNLSARQLGDAELAGQIRAALSHSGVPPSRLRLEVVESTLVALERSPGFLAALQQTGIGLHVDDFGTGYSSLTALHRLPIRALKIARGLVNQLHAVDSLALARSVIAVAHSLDVVAIGAGIETAVQREALLSLGCEDGQGIAVAPVLDAAATGALLAGRPGAEDLADGSQHRR